MATYGASDQAVFYDEFLRTRSLSDPKEFGVSLERLELIERIKAQFDHTYGIELPIRKLLLRPREAMRFCDEFRRQHFFFDLPDDIILAAL